MKDLLTSRPNCGKLSALLAASAMLVGTLPVQAEWRHARGDGGNSSFARVNTAPAIKPRVLHTGPTAPGVNPVIGNGGVVYVGNLLGEVRAFRADGTTYWTRQIPSDHGSIFSSPVVSADGSVYVISTIHHEDSKDNESFLHKFTESGGYVFRQRFPNAQIYPFTDGGTAAAPPNIWRSNGTEAIIVPVVYKGMGRRDVSLVAFSPITGGVLATKQIEIEVYEITGGFDWPGFLEECVPLNIWNAATVCIIVGLLTGNIGVPFNPPALAPPLGGAGFPFPEVAILPNPRGGAPFVIATDRRHDKVVYTFSPENGFQEVAHSTNDKQQFVTPPVVLGDGSTVVGNLQGNLIKTGPNLAELPWASGLGTLTAAPTRLSDGSLAIVSRQGTVTRIGLSVSKHTPGGQSIVSAAASCTHVFVSTTDGLFTFNTKDMQQVAVLPWSGGGLSAPIIGPWGDVYALALDHIFVFPGPSLGKNTNKTACDVLAPTKLGTVLSRGEKSLD